MEVAGLVLGVLPLAIQAIETYRDILHSIKSVKRDLDNLIRDLGTERLLLENTCESLLVGIAPPSKIDAMIEDPFGPEWKKFNDQLRLRLWRSSGQFEKKVAEMNGAVTELTRKLGLEADGTVRNSRIPKVSPNTRPLGLC
jgi:hypothetical protein